MEKEAFFVWVVKIAKEKTYVEENKKVTDCRSKVIRGSIFKNKTFGKPQRIHVDFNPVEFMNQVKVCYCLSVSSSEIDSNSAYLYGTEIIGVYDELKRAEIVEERIKSGKTSSLLPKTIKNPITEITPMVITEK